MEGQYNHFINAKDIAETFLKKYYPEYLNQIDRIWEFLDTFDLNLDSAVDFIFQPKLGIGFGFAASNTNPKFIETVSGVITIKFSFQQEKDVENLSIEDFKKAIYESCDKFNLSMNLRKKLEFTAEEYYENTTTRGLPLEEKLLKEELGQKEPHLKSALEMLLSFESDAKLDIYKCFEIVTLLKEEHSDSLKATKAFSEKFPDKKLLGENDLPNNRNPICIKLMLDCMNEISSVSSSILFPHIPTTTDSEGSLVVDFKDAKFQDEYERITIDGNVGLGRNKSRVEEYISYAKTDENIIILGNSGTGKDGLANFIHKNSKRNEKPLKIRNLSALSKNLIESELFGHMKESFTGAKSNKEGLFKLADTGTVFLDEIGKCDKTVQHSLLRVLQSGEIQPIGGIPEKVDVRIIAATSEKLEEEIIKKNFSGDLYYRFILSINLPDLKNQRGNIPFLVYHFLKEYAVKHDLKLKNITLGSLHKLINHDWPGNIRELRNVTYRACVKTKDTIKSSDINIQSNNPLTETSSFYHNQSNIIKYGKIKLAQRALRLAQFNKREAAKIAGIPESTFYKLIKFNQD